MKKHELDDDQWDFLCTNSPKLVVKNITNDLKKATPSLSTNASSADGHSSVNMSGKNATDLNLFARSSITPTKLRLQSPKPPTRDKTPQFPYTRPMLKYKSLTKKILKPNLLDSKNKYESQLNVSAENIKNSSQNPMKFRIKTKLQPALTGDLRKKLERLGLFSSRD
ncbi:unnamed protein product [Blepharisma stoltei]|uniref:Uncharacterized protein n=1 Tax=Blepharisma stoltei TaxID=1481888 RepID=A0AAU9ITC1_9CILI|nr:unnamed protein product [Blepharisma stoltei]